MQKIIPHLWFDKEAKEAAEFYTATFPDSKLTNITTIHDTPSGDCDVVSFELWGYSFMAISAGPLFTFNPSVSFMVNFDPAQGKDATARIDKVWGNLSAGGNILMPLDKYPFSERYGWVQDKYGLSWQLILTNPEGEERPIIIPFLLFVGDFTPKQKKLLTSISRYSRTPNAALLSAMALDRRPTKKGPSCLLISCLKISGSPRWTARTNTISNSTRLSH